jgi:hypothetical protein
VYKASRCYHHETHTLYVHQSQQEVLSRVASPALESCEPRALDNQCTEEHMRQNVPDLRVRSELERCCRHRLSGIAGAAPTQDREDGARAAVAA